MFAVWITGRPASGKSTVTAALVRELRRRGIDPAVLESDVFHRFWTPHPAYSEEERAAFYGAMTHVGRLLASHGVPVIFDATANRRVYRARAREQIPRFIEVFVDCPPEVCEARDSKGLYRQARAGTIATLPGVQVEYEAPDAPDVHVRSEREDPESAARRIVDELVRRGYVPPAGGRRA